MMPFPWCSQFLQRFAQHFELLQKACLPDHASYFSFNETVANARFSVSNSDSYTSLNYLLAQIVWLPICQTLPMHNCFKDAQRIAKDLRGSFANDPGRLAELRQIEQVAEHNYVALNLLCRLGNLEPSLKISFEFIHHPYFATAAVKRSWWSKKFWYFLFEQFYFVSLALVLRVSSLIFRASPPKN